MQSENFQIKCQYSSVIYTILSAIQDISIHLEQTPVMQLQSVNKFGDKQLHQDVFTDELVQKHLKENKEIFGFASEERPVLHEFSERQASGYIVTYDPLDGSSIIDTNFSVGSIFSIWPYTDKKLIGEKVKLQTNAMLAVYGPRTTVILWNPEVQKVQELTLVEKSRWILSHEHLVIKPQTKMFSPGNLRAVTENPDYRNLVDEWISKGYTLRYTGGLVPDICQFFIKGHGIFSNIASKSHKAKLRVVYEVAAVAYLLEKAGGKTMTIGKGSVLEYQIVTLDDRMSFGGGSQNQVQKLSALF